MLDVMFYEVFDREEEALKRHLPKKLKADFTWKTVQEFGEAKPPAKVISIRTQSYIPNQWAKKIDGILTRSAGYDHVVDYLKESGTDIPSGYLIDYCSRAVAEQAVMLMMSCFRKLKKQLKQFENFQRDSMCGVECLDKNLLVFGVGHIGTEIVRLGKALKMKVKGVDIVKRVKSLEYVSLPEGIAWADVVICSAALTSQTRGLLDYKILSQGKKGLVLVNIARGEITPMEDMKQLLQKEKMGALAQDVFEQEGRLAQKLREIVDDPQTRTVLELAKREDVIFTPHNAFNTQESLERKAKESSDSLKHFFKNKKFLHPVTAK